jgi:hypothetical protein
VTLSRGLSIGGAVLLVAGIALAIGGVKIVGFACAALGAVGLVSWAFLKVGESEDRARERGEL